MTMTMNKTPPTTTTTTTKTTITAAAATLSPRRKPLLLLPPLMPLLLLLMVMILGGTNTIIQPAEAADSSDDAFAACAELAAVCGQDADCSTCLAAGVSEDADCQGAEDEENPTCETYGALACCTFVGDNASCLDNELWLEFVVCALETFGCSLDDLECADGISEGALVAADNGAAVVGGKNGPLPVAAAVAAAAGVGGALVSLVLGAVGL